MTENTSGTMFASLRGVDVESVEVQQSAGEIVYLYVHLEGVDGKLSLVLGQEQALELSKEMNMAAKHREGSPAVEDFQQ